MKSFPLIRIVHFMIMLALALGSQACEGPEGPPGPEGLPGVPGPTGPAGPASATAQVLELGGWDFTKNDTLGFSFEDFDLAVTESDLVLAYRYEFGYYDAANNPTFVWSPLPKIKILSKGIFQYDFYHSLEFIDIFVNAQFDINTLSTSEKATYLTQEAFRIVVIPGVLVNGRMSTSQLDYDDLVKYFKIEEKDVRKLKLK